MLPLREPELCLPSWGLQTGGSGCGCDVGVCAWLGVCGSVCPACGLHHNIQYAPDAWMVDVE
jgi:hypothetical protein